MTAVYLYRACYFLYNWRMVNHLLELIREEYNLEMQFLDCGKIINHVKRAK